jgi:bifunctional oligoribonuclease and PAP phosphatase NrnA
MTGNKEKLFLCVLLIFLKLDMIAAAEWLEIKKVIQVSQRTVIVTHPNPDGDAIGSSLGLGMYLKKRGHEISVVIPDDMPQNLHWIPGQDMIINFEKDNRKVEEKIESATLIFCLDFNNLKRIREIGGMIHKSKAFKIMIDHHLQPEGFADFDLHTVSASSTAELVYTFIENLGDLNLIDSSMAEALYAGIVTDTGSFQYPSTTPRVHRIVAKLMETGIKTFEIYDRIYNTSDVNRLKFFGFCWLERMEIIKKYKTGIIAISQKDQFRFYLKKGDTEGLVNTPLGIKGIQLGILATEQDNYVKFSFRSKGEIDVNKWARKHFNGGGHKNAAGGRLEGKLHEAVIILKEAIPELMKTK